MNIPAFKFFLISFALLAACTSKVDLQDQIQNKPAETSSGVNTVSIATNNIVRGVDVSAKTITKTDLDDLRLMKANVIRPLFTEPGTTFIIEKPDGTYAFDLNAFKLLDTLVKWCAERQLKIIVNPHTLPGSISRYTGNPDDRFWTDINLQNKFVDMWVQISNHCKTGSSFIMYDIFNEPCEPANMNGKWNELAARAIRAIRANGDVCDILLQPTAKMPWVSRIDNLVNLVIPFGVTGVIISPHLYDPESYTHQGIGSYPVGGQFVGDTRTKMYDAINKIRAYQNSHSGVKVLIGEFGVARVETDGDSYIAEAISAFEYYGWHWIYHSFREAYPWNPEMALGTNDWLQPASNTIRMNLLKNEWSKNVFN